MSTNLLRYGILVFGLVTGVIHAVVLNLLGFDLLMLLNGIGFIVFTLIVFFNPASLAEQRKGIIYLFIAYTLVTIIGFFLMNDPPYGPLGIIAKIDEILLVIFLWLYRDR